MVVLLSMAPMEFSAGREMGRNFAINLLKRLGSLFTAAVDLTSAECLCMESEESAVEQLSWDFLASAKLEERSCQLLGRLTIPLAFRVAIASGRAAIVEIRYFFIESP